MNIKLSMRAFAAAIFMLLSLCVTPASAAEEPRSIDSVRFRFKADGPVRGGLSAADGKLLFGTENGTFYALDARTGITLWQAKVGSGIASVPAVRNGLVYFSSWDNALHALDIQSGRERWKSALGTDVGTTNYWDFYSSSPTLVDNSIYVGSGNGRLYALDASSGQTQWSSDAGARIRTTPAVAGNKVVFGTLSGHVIALDRATGKRLWDFATQGAAQDFSFKGNDTRSVITAPIIQDGIVVAGGRDGNVYGIDLATGKERWKETHDGGSWILGLNESPGRVYSSSGSAFIMQATDLRTGKEIWRSPTAGNAMFGGIVKAGDVLVSNGMKGNLFGFDASSGQQLWRFRLPDAAFGTPTIADGAVFTASDDGSVVAINGSANDPTGFKRLVYSFTDEPAASLYWFTPDALASIKGSFVGAGYTPIGNAELSAALSGPDAGRTILAVADTRFADGIDGSAIRRFLDAGGKLVLVGPNPVAYSFDPKTGEPQTVDEDKAAAAFGMTALPHERDYGWHVGQYTPDAALLGLTGQLVSNGPMAPDQVSMVLARDRFGMASAWAKQFPNGGLLVQLPVSRNRPQDLSAIVDAVDIIAQRAAAGTPQANKKARRSGRAF